MMNISQLIQKGDELFCKQRFEEAFGYYREAYMLGDAFGAYMMAECYVIAFYKQNLDNISYANHREYVKSAIELYTVASERFNVSSPVPVEVALCDDAMIKILFLRRLTRDSRCDSDEEAIYWELFENDAKEHRNHPKSYMTAMIVSADIHARAYCLLRLGKQANMMFLRIAALSLAYRHARHNGLYGMELGEVVQALIECNAELGTKFNISQLSSAIPVLGSVRPIDDPGIWQDIDPNEWDEQSDCSYDLYGSSFRDDYGYSYDEDDDCYEEEGYCDEDGFFCRLEDYWQNNYDDC